MYRMPLFITDRLCFSLANICKVDLLARKGAEKPAKGRKGKVGKDPSKPKISPDVFYVFM